VTSKPGKRCAGIRLLDPRIISDCDPAFVGLPRHTIGRREFVTPYSPNFLLILKASILAPRGINYDFNWHLTSPGAWIRCERLTEFQSFAEPLLLSCGDILGGLSQMDRENLLLSREESPLEFLRQTRW